MTKTLLEQYPDICGELEELQKHHLFPDRQEGLQAQKSEIEHFVNSLPTSRQRWVVMLRAMQGLTWQQVAGRMGGRYSVDGAKKLYYKALNKFL